MFIGLDQLGNALTGGHPDVTVSARVGYLATLKERGWFMFMERLIDFAFWPVDGPNHCVASWAHQRDVDIAKKVRRGNDAGLALLTAGIMWLVPLLWVVNLVRRWFR